MIDKIIMLNARKEYKEDCEKLCKSKFAEIAQMLQNKANAPAHPVNPKKSNSRALFKLAVQERTKKLEKSGEYKNYTIQTNEDTITA